VLLCSDTQIIPGETKRHYRVRESDRDTSETQI